MNKMVKFCKQLLKLHICTYHTLLTEHKHIYVDIFRGNLVQTRTSRDSLAWHSPYGYGYGIWQWHQLYSNETLTDCTVGKVGIGTHICSNESIKM